MLEYNYVLSFILFYLYITYLCTYFAEIRVEIIREKYLAVENCNLKCYCYIY